MSSSRAVRTANRGVATRLTNECRQLILERDGKKAKVVLETLRRKHSQLESIDKDMVAIMEDEECILQFVTEGEMYLTNLYCDILLLETEVNAIPGQTVSLPNRTHNSSDFRKSTLPKLQLPKFGGDLLEWSTFWGLYEAAVHNNQSISEIEKFSYLKCQLQNDAKSCIDGLPLTPENYISAVTLLKERFGQTHRITQAYICALIDLTPPTNDRLSLRRFYDQVETYIRHLESLGKSPDTYGTMLVPIMLEKLPVEFRHNIARTNQKQSGDWSISELRSAILSEIQLYETCNSMSSLVKSERSETATVANLHASVRSQTGNRISGPSNRNKRNCIFCSNSSHSSSQCTDVTDVNRHVEIVKNAQLCFNCLGKHRVSNCRSTDTCHHCSKKHHTSLCFSRSTSGNRANTANSSTRPSGANNTHSSTSTGSRSD